MTEILRHGAFLGWAAEHLEGNSQNLAGMFLPNCAVNVQNSRNLTAQCLWLPRQWGRCPARGLPRRAAPALPPRRLRRGCGSPRVPARLPVTAVPDTDGRGDPSRGGGAVGREEAVGDVRVPKSEARRRARHASFSEFHFEWHILTPMLSWRKILEVKPSPNLA